MASFKIVFFKRSKIRVFDYTPRYWDPDKERLEERKRAIAQEMGVALPEYAIDPDAPYRSNIKGQMKRHFEAGKRKSSKFSGGRVFVFVLLFLIVLGAYFGSNLFGLLFTEVNKRQNKERQEEPKRPRNEDTHYIIPLP
ncbi:MAG: hypothetical protein LBG19_12330 [Prevotellaceae bacterium]|jgi:hypothetical protein|nr:hypothetical protein [Prevotellaceae bacterium]